MNKSDLIATIAENAGLSVQKAEKALSAALASIQQALTQHDDVSLVGFGRFGIKKRAGRTVRNPQTGKVMSIDPTIVPFFKAGKGLKEQVDNNEE